MIEETTAEEEKPKRKDIIGIIIKVLIYSIILSVISVAAYFGFKYYKSTGEKYSEKTLINVKSNESKLKFSFDNLRKVYKGIIKIDKEIVLIDEEIERINKIETDYPNQKKITAAEKKIWKKVKKKLIKVLAKVEQTLEIIFVTYKVNPEKGMKIINKNNGNLENMINEVLVFSNEQTATLKLNKEQTFFEKIKNIF
ncbi:MAG: hypothetical protein GY714_24505 [Desulfobacterales bacterium]|nr:hypothetical protein [Desulfobacterales bacterium]